MSTDDPIFKWEEISFGYRTLARIEAGKRIYQNQLLPEYDIEDSLVAINKKRCSWCRKTLAKGDWSHTNKGKDAGGIGGMLRVSCSRCGWYGQGSSYSSSLWGDDPDENLNEWSWFGVTNGKHGILRSFSQNDRQNVSIEELGTHLKKRWNSIYDIEPRTVEDLVANIFRNNGFQTVLTAKTRDSGADVLLLNDSGIVSVVEVKRYRNKPIGISLVQRLVGSMISYGAKKAHFVTTSRFTRPALAEKGKVARGGFVLDLWDADRFLLELSTFNENIPDKSLFGKEILRKFGLDK